MCISVDLLVSITLSLIVNMSRFLTRQRYQYACMFAYHNYDFKYVHILKSQTVYEAVEAKEYFEENTESHGVEIKHYHDENGIFRSALWMNHCKDMHQGLTFYGVNAHHQNGQAERHIRLLQKLACC